MRNSEKTLLALNDVDDRHLESAGARLGYRQSSSVTSLRRKRIVSIALAAALILALAIAAYAADLFGIRAMSIKDAAATEPNGGILSMTQPQDVPDEMGEAVRAKIDNSAKAWAEWKAWRDKNGVTIPDVYDPPKGTGFFNEEENSDGSYTVRFYAIPDAPAEETALWWEHMEQGDYSDFVLLAERTATKAEHDANEKAEAARAMGYRGYDFKYGVQTKEMADKLESIAASYGLKVRHRSTVLNQDFGGHPELYSREQITAKINGVCAGGKSFFHIEPTGYDKFYYYDEGTFAVSFYTTGDFTNAGTRCYLYNSPYGTLSSGYEIVDEVQDVSAFTTREHTTRDGTKLTVLQNGQDIYAYVYLINSFVTVHIFQPEGLSDAEIDAVLDMVDFGTIR